MAALEQNDDLQAIRSLIGAHFRGLRWAPDTRPDWVTFSADFLPDASLSREPSIVVLHWPGPRR